MFLLMGARDVMPLALAVFPFGLVYGVAVVESSIVDWVGLLASVLIFAGAAQLAVVDLLDQGAPWFIVVGTALVINARLTMYSGALAPAFAEFPRRMRIPLAHLMTDQTAVVSLLFNERERDARRRMSYYLGAGSTMLAMWTFGTVLGVVVGATIPAQLQIGFAVPLMFIALLVPSVRDRASLVAAAVGFSATLLAKDAPLSSGLLIGATAGIGFGLLATRSGTSRGEGPKREAGDG